jgi:hypothetical protein
MGAAPMPIGSKYALAAAGLLVLLALPSGAPAAEPVRSIGIYVEPYYASPRAPGERRRVAVGKLYDVLLASDRREDIRAARDLVLAKPQRVTPMTLMVLAIRFYDVGLRDDAVFWFYAAKDRYLVLAEVLDVRDGGLAQVENAIRNFSSLAGPAINGYAFCDLAKQQAAHAQAIAWVEANPYEVMFMDRLPALAGDRAANHKKALAAAKQRAAKERSYFDDANNRAAFYAARKKNETDVKFCWP